MTITDDKNTFRRECAGLGRTVSERGIGEKVHGMQRTPEISAPKRSLTSLREREGGREGKRERERQKDTQTKNETKTKRDRERRRGGGEKEMKREREKKRERGGGRDRYEHKEDGKKTKRGRQTDRQTSHTKGIQYLLHFISGRVTMITYSLPT